MKKVWKHIPIMVNEILEHIPDYTQAIMDGTMWHGGHTQAFIDHIQQWTVVAVDKDPHMTKKISLENPHPDTITIKTINTPYDNLWFITKESNISHFDYILLDIGINREHVVDSERGFSIKQSWPLDMRFDPTTWISAKEYIMTMKPEEFTQALMQYGDFSLFKAKQISLAITQNRKTLETTKDLMDILYQIKLNDRKCAVVFQVIRICVNNELEHLENFLESFSHYLNPWWRCAIITFHSVEDRIVKQAFKKLSLDDWFKLINKRVIIPHWKEREKNKASRSAKLRIIEKI